MQTVAIIGAGELGATTARALAAAEAAREVRLIDSSAQVAAGKALDIFQANPIDGADARITAGSDLEAVRGASAIVMADRVVEGEWQGEAALAQLRRVTAFEPAAPIVCAGARQLELVRLGLAELRLDRARILGSAPEALRAAARSMLALMVNGAPSDVSLALVGVPPAWVFGWSAATVAGQPLGARLGEMERSRAERRALACWPPGSYALGSAAAAAVTAILGSARREITCFVGRDGTGGRPLVAAFPVRLGPSGVAGVHEPVLSPRERVEFESALSR